VLKNLNSLTQDFICPHQQISRFFFKKNFSAVFNPVLIVTTINSAIRRQKQYLSPSMSFPVEKPETHFKATERIILPYNCGNVYQELSVRCPLSCIRNQTYKISKQYTFFRKVEKLEDLVSVFIPINFCLYFQ